MATTLILGCGRGDRQHLNDNPNDLGMPDSPTVSDSPLPGQPNGYAPAGSGNTKDTATVGVDSTTRQAYQ
jgi:hypothetical protein